MARFHINSSINVREQVAIVNGLKLGFNGQNFHTRAVLICEVNVTDEMPLFGAIEHTLHCRGLWLLCCFLYQTTRYKELYDAFCIEKTSDWTVILCGEQASHPPLASYTIDNCYGVLLSHRSVQSDSFHYRCTNLQIVTRLMSFYSTCRPYIQFLCSRLRNKL